MSERANVLHVEHVTMQFGGVVAMNDLSMEVNEGEIVALIGPPPTASPTGGSPAPSRTSGCSGR